MRLFQYEKHCFLLYYDMDPQIPPRLHEHFPSGQGRLSGTPSSSVLHLGGWDRLECPFCVDLRGGRGRDRTCDLLLVRYARPILPQTSIVYNGLQKRVLATSKFSENLLEYPVAHPFGCTLAVVRALGRRSFCLQILVGLVRNQKGQVLVEGHAPSRGVSPQRLLRSVTLSVPPLRRSSYAHGE